MKIDVEKMHLGIVGLGYVGLPLAVEFGKKFKTTGFDLNNERVNSLLSGFDETNEVSSKELLQFTDNLVFTNDLEEIAACNVYIVTVPTPIDSFNNPDLTPLISASKMLSGIIKKGDVVVYESTVYPGATEEVCVPILESGSNLSLNSGFYVGYSPERINPGDKLNKLTNILKVTSGSSESTANFVNSLYASIITAGTFNAGSIKVAEAAKVIENTQRDMNIALINELAMIFSVMGIDTKSVLDAASTKWNFLPFKPGLVGGHCIGVDPYYLTHKAQSIGYYPEMILAGRRINNNMSRFVASELIKEMLRKKITVSGSRVLLLGFAFKENCPDYRNTRIFDLLSELKSYQMNVDINDPWVSQEKVHEEYGVGLIDNIKPNTYDAVILAVGHEQFIELGEQITTYAKDTNVIYDLKHVLKDGLADLRL